jgi:hypothetical protein
MNSFFVVALLGALLLWYFAWRARPILGLGITVGIMVTWMLLALVGLPKFEHVPLWLPPLPFAVVAVTLFAFGILAWVWGADEQPSSPSSQDGTAHHPH